MPRLLGACGRIRRRRAHELPIHDNDIVILAGARTPFGNLGGRLPTLPLPILLSRPRSGHRAQRRAEETIDDVVFGNVMQTSADAIYLARHVGLRAGIPVTCRR